ncbi:MAG: hypothetical protein M3Y42_07645 [Actinomycetota bacterium]|nr:hypothetical protein [Actinomycetota bacterium]MDQ2956822.1 hypothetical protein [Actinomycetota bacterium]
MTGRKIVLLLVVAFLIFFVMNSPTDAAAVVKNTQHLLGHLFTSLTKFIDSFRN